MNNKKIRRKKWLKLIISLFFTIHRIFGKVQQNVVQHERNERSTKTGKSESIQIIVDIQLAGRSDSRVHERCGHDFQYGWTHDEGRLHGLNVCWLRNCNKNPLNFSIGVLNKIKWCAWIAVYCAFVGFANARTSEDTKQVLSCFMWVYDLFLIIRMNRIDEDTSLVMSIWAKSCQSQQSGCRHVKSFLEIALEDQV